MTLFLKSVSKEALFLLKCKSVTVGHLPYSRADVRVMTFAVEDTDQNGCCFFFFFQSRFHLHHYMTQKSTRIVFVVVTFVSPRERSLPADAVKDTSQDGFSLLKIIIISN